MTYTLIDAIHETDQINEGTVFAVANDGQHYLISTSLVEIQAAAGAARADGHQVNTSVYRSLTDADCEEQLSERCGQV